MINLSSIKKISLAFVLGGALLAALFLISAPFVGKSNIAEAKKKSKWQLRLERDQIPSVFWRKYLPTVKQKEHKKALKKYNAYLKNISSNYLLHRNITTTTFWVGEAAGPDNNNISNSPSAWDEKWMDHFGGYDDPNHRNAYYPASFTPSENPFYFALPYNEFDKNGNRRSDAMSLIPWSGEKIWAENESMCKNRWIKIIHKNKVAYAQWEDVGPFLEDDSAYVFGNSAPRSTENNRAGLDVSPAVRDYLDISGMDACDWQFVDPQNVPSGPWKNIVTSSSVYWE